MKTVSVNVMTLCAPCANRCRYCLLSYDGRVNGTDPDRAMDYARRFSQWLRENRPEVGFLFGWGYAMEHLRLPDMIRCARELGCVTGEFLQFDGMALRTEGELVELLANLKTAGIRLIDLTFYGTEEYHDRFAARRGDYRLMMDTLKAANRVGLDVSVSIPLTRENLPELEQMGFDGAMRYLEVLDDAYHRTVPPFSELRRLYGDPDGQSLYSFRDLHQHYQRRYIAEHGLELYDIHDEQQCFVRRF